MSESERQTYTMKEVQARFGLGRNAAYAAVKSGAIPSIRIGKKILIPKAPVDRLLDGKAA
jgi:excisionase family DNA binding protein